MYIHVIYVHFCPFASIFSINIKTQKKCWPMSESRQSRRTFQRKSSVFHRCFSCAQTCGGCGSQSQLSLGEGGVSPWTSQQFIKGPHKRQTSSVLSRVPSWPRIHVCGLWEDAGGATHILRKHANITQWGHIADQLYNRIALCHIYKHSNTWIPFFL